MDQVKKLLAALSTGQKAGIVIAALLAVFGTVALVRWKHESDFKPLFTEMSGEDAAAVVQKLKEGGVEYRISDNGASVLVPSEKLDEVRLEMAGAGLPKTGRAGFELFDKTNLGVTDFTEHVNYGRALEGELERSIRSLSEVEQARVHITFPKDSVFLDSREPAKASALIRLRPGAHLSAQNVTAITNLVASAVEGLAPESVSVLDTQGNLLSRPRMLPLDGENTQAELDYKRQVEKDLAAKVEATLEPVLGPGKFRVGISADCDFTTSDQSEEMFDPSKSVMATQQKSEDVTGSAQTSGVPGTASNLPNAAPRTAVPASASRRTESVAYQTSRMVKHVKIPQGQIKRISASLLLDQDFEWQGSGKQKKRVPVPPSPEKVKAIHDVVAAALGLVSDRGDQLVIESLPFEETALATALDSAPAPPPPSSLPRPSMRTVAIAGGATVLLVICGFFLIRRGRSRAELIESATSLTAPQSVPVTASEHTTPDAAMVAEAVAAAVPKLQLPPMTKKVEVLRDHVRENVQNDPAFAASVLRGWLEDDTK